LISSSLPEGTPRSSRDQAILSITSPEQFVEHFHFFSVFDLFPEEVRCEGKKRPSRWINAFLLNVALMNLRVSHVPLFLDGTLSLFSAIYITEEDVERFLHLSPCQTSEIEPLTYPAAHSSSIISSLSFLSLLPTGMSGCRQILPLPLTAGSFFSPSFSFSPVNPYRPILVPSFWRLIQFQPFPAYP